MDKKAEKFDYEKPKLEDMSKQRTSGSDICSTGSAAAGGCTSGTSPGISVCKTGTGEVVGQRYSQR